MGLTVPELRAGSSLFTSAWVSSRNCWALANRQEKVSGLTATRATWQEPVETDTPAVPTPWPHRPPSGAEDRVGGVHERREWVIVSKLRAQGFST